MREKKKTNDSRSNRQSPETGKGVDGGAWEVMAGRKLINGLNNEKYKTIKKQKKIDGRNQRSKERIVELLNSSLSTLTTARFVVLSFMVF